MRQELHGGDRALLRAAVGELMTAAAAEAAYALHRPVELHYPDPAGRAQKVCCSSLSGCPAWTAAAMTSRSCSGAQPQPWRSLPRCASCPDVGALRACAHRPVAAPVHAWVRPGPYQARAPGACATITRCPPSRRHTQSVEGGVEVAFDVLWHPTPIGGTQRGDRIALRSSVDRRDALDGPNREGGERGFIQPRGERLDRRVPVLGDRRRDTSADGPTGSTLAPRRVASPDHPRDSSNAASRRPLRAHRPIVAPPARHPRGVAANSPARIRATRASTSARAASSCSSVRVVLTAAAPTP